MEEIENARVRVQIGQDLNQTKLHRGSPPATRKEHQMRKSTAVLAAAAALIAAPMAASSIAVNGASAIHGSFGMQTSITAVATDAYVRTDDPLAETSYNAEFWINPNNLPLTEGNAGTNHIRFMRINDNNEEGGDPAIKGTFLVGFITKSADDHDYHMIFWVKQNGTTAFNSVGNLYLGEEDPNNVPAHIRIEFDAANNPSTSLVLKNLTTGQTITRSNLNMSDADVNFADFGCFTNSNPSGIVGSYAFDDFVSTR